uniref:Uncharacterized protein n=1 Tax=Anguilla anguilla TaxID=7936 RepID=A0A0E9VW82_ANGAN
MTQASGTFFQLLSWNNFRQLGVRSFVISHSHRTRCKYDCVSLVSMNIHSSPK